MAKKILVWLCVITVFFNAGCQAAGINELRNEDFTDPEVEESINDYLVEHVAITGFGGLAFCGHELLNADQGKEGFLYLWALCQEYHLEQGPLTDGSGISLPVALQIEPKDHQIEIIGHLIPRDGSYYGPDVRDIFPKSTWSQIMPENEQEINQYNSRANELMRETRMKAKWEYNTESED